MQPTLLLRHCAASALAALACSTAAADAAPPRGWSPDQLFVQSGFAEDAKALTAGAIWTTEWSRPFGGGLLNLYWEVSFGRWSTEQPDGSTRSSWVTQLGVTPVLRWHPSGDTTRWYVEGGIGANVLLPVYRSREKEFSTTFNFGDHLAIGTPFGEQGRHEIALRLQHYSNAGIKRPNPGEDFVQVRYVYKF